MPEERSTTAAEGKAGNKKAAKSPRGKSADPKDAGPEKAKTQGPATAKTSATKKTSAAKKTPAAAKKTPAAAKTKTETKKPSTRSSTTTRATRAPAADKAPPTQDTAEAEGAGENPLHRKLGLRPGIAGVIIAAPENAANPLLPLPDSCSPLAEAGELEALDGLFDYIHVFARDRGELVETFGLLRDKLAPAGSLWVSWIKQGSARRGSGLLGDLNENVIRRIALTNGLVDVKIAALDRNWSALRLVHRRR